MGRASRWLLGLFGWQLQGAAPTAPRFVFIAAPHTSNWDFIWMLLAASALGFKISWLGKHTLFKAPFGVLMRRLGGVAIKRDSGGDYVSQIAIQFEQAENLALAVPVEGTRGRSEHWRSGFYYIAQAAEVPIVFSYLDYGRRLVGIGPTLPPGMTLTETMDQARAFYAPMRGKYPHLSGPARLKEEADEN